MSTVLLDLQAGSRGRNGRVARAEWDLASIMDPDAVAGHHQPDPVMLRRRTELRALQVVLSLVTFDGDFGDLKGWDEVFGACSVRLRRRPDQ